MGSGVEGGVAVVLLGITVETARRALGWPLALVAGLALL